MFDTLLRGGTVIDGTGRAAFAADVAIENGKIAAVGQLSHAQARRTVDCTGMTVTPGFIDIHRHADGRGVSPRLRGVGAVSGTDHHRQRQLAACPPRLRAG